MIHPWNQAAWSALPPFERLPPVLLVAGPYGVGKAAFARTLAQALLCTARPASRLPCGTCHGCRLFESSNHPDFRTLEPATAEEDEGGAGEEGGSRSRSTAAARWIKVDAVRGLADFLSLTSHLAGTKVVLVEPAERLHPSAANALLKTLEEPINTRFLLVSGQPARLPATVRSRCVRVVLPLPDAAASQAWLRAQGIDDPAVPLAMAGGSPRLALEMSGPEQLQLRRRLIDMVFSNSRFDPVAAVDSLGPEQIAVLVPALQRWCYDLLLHQANGQVRYYPDCAQILHPLARRATAHALLRFVKELQQVTRHIEHPLNQRLLAERCLIGYRNAIAGTET